MVEPSISIQNDEQALLALFEPPQGSVWDSWEGKVKTPEEKAAYEKQYFVRLTPQNGRPDSLPLPTLHTYVIPGMLLDQQPITTQEWRTQFGSIGGFESQQNIYFNLPGQLMRFEEHSQLLLNLFDWFHLPRRRNSNFLYLREFERVLQSMLSGFKYELFKYRFVDV